MYFLLTVATFTYNHFTGINSFDIVVFVSNLTFLRGYFDDLLFTGISQGWSLTVEETFYFLAPFIFLIINRGKKAILYLSLFFILVGLLLVLIFKGVSFYHFMGSLHFMFYYTFFGRCVEFFLGIQLARRFKEKGTNKPHYFKAWYTVLGAVGMFASVLIIAVVNDYIKVTGSEWIILFLSNLVFPLVVYCFLKGLILENTLLQRFLATPLMGVLGKSSYTFYLIHIGFISYFLGGYLGLGTIGMFVVLNVISILFYYTLEHPLNTLIRRINNSEKVLSVLN